MSLGFFRIRKLGGGLIPEFITFSRGYAFVYFLICPLGLAVMMPLINEAKSHSHMVNVLCYDRYFSFIGEDFAVIDAFD